MAKPLSDKIAALKAKRQELAARQAALEAKEKTEDRKRQTRRKIVIGGAILAAIEDKPAIAEQLRGVLAKYVGRDVDRAVIADLLGASPAPPSAGGE